MRKKLRMLAAWATIIAIAASAGLFGFRLSGLRAAGERSAGAEYSILRNAIIPIEVQSDLSDEFLRNRLSALFQGSARLLAAQVQNADGLTVWRIPASSQYFAKPGDQGSVSGFIAPESSTVIFSTPLSGGMKVAAIYTTLKRSDISKAALPSLLLSSAWFGVLLLVALLLKKEEETESQDAAGEISDDAVPNAAVPDSMASRNLEEEAASDEPSDEISDEAEIDVEPDVPVEPAKLEEFDSDSPEDLDEVVEELVELEEMQDEELGEDAPSEAEPEKKPSQGRNFEESLARLEEEIREWSQRKEAQVPAQAPSASPIPVAQPIQQQASMQPQEPLEAPRAGIEEARERKAPQLQQVDEKRDLADLPLPLSLQDQALQSRLITELERGSFDLALLLIHCGLGSDSYPAGDPAAAALAATLRDYVGSKELVFELYKGGFAVILPSVDLGAALKMSEDLADVLGTTLSLYMDIESEAPVYMGISSVARRKADAGKLYREASTALHKAFSGGPSRILAFRPRPE